MLLVLSSAVAALWLPVVSCGLERRGRAGLQLGLRSAARQLLGRPAPACAAAGRDAGGELDHRALMARSAGRPPGSGGTRCRPSSCAPGATRCAMRSIHSPRWVPCTQRSPSISGGPVALLVLKDAAAAGNDDSAALRVGEADADQLRGPVALPAPGAANRAGHRALRGAVGLVPAAARPRRQPRCRGVPRARRRTCRPGSARPRTGAVRSTGSGAAARAGRPRGTARPRAGAGPGRPQRAARRDLARLPHPAGDDHGRRVVAGRAGRAAVAPSSGSGWRTASSRRPTQLSRLTDNTLQLARLDAPGVSAALRLGVGRGDRRRGAAPRAPARPDAPRAGAARARPAAAVVRCDADVAAARQPGRQRAEVQPAGVAGRGPGPAAGRAGRAGGARPRPGHRAGVARARLRGLPPRRRVDDGRDVAPWRRCRGRARVSASPSAAPSPARTAASCACGRAATAAAASSACCRSGRHRRSRPRAAPHMTLRVLLVEDDRELRKTLRDALDVEGYEVLTAASLSEGARAAGRRRARGGRSRHRPRRARPRSARRRRRGAARRAAAQALAPGARDLGAPGRGPEDPPARCRCRRLPRQAVQHRRAAGADARGAAPPRHHGAGGADALPARRADGRPGQPARAPRRHARCT